MSPPDLSELMAKAKEVQERIAEVQRGLAARRVEGSSGGGMVVAVASGELRILELRIEPSLVEAGDLAMLQDLTAAAVNAALANAQKLIQEEMQRASAGLQLGLPVPGAGG